MYSEDLSFARDAVEEACRVARRVQEELVTGRDRLTKEDRSPVTVADLAVQALITRRLAESYPSDELLAEEASGVLQGQLEVTQRVLEVLAEHLPGLDASALARLLDRGDATGEAGRRRWLLDPVDGTKGFLRGDQYAIALALLDEGRVVVGVLGCPNLPVTAEDDEARGCLFSAALGHGTSLRLFARGTERPAVVSPTQDPSEGILCESVEAAHADISDQHAIAQRLGIHRPPVRMDSQCKYGLLARGDASIYLRLPRSGSYREKVWDHAAGTLVIEEAGGRVSDLTGAPLDFSHGAFIPRQGGIVATNGHLHDVVLEACREVLGSS